MKDIDGIHQVLEVIKPHMGGIEKHFSDTNETFNNLMQQSHDDIGRVLKCHLIVEHFLTKFVSDFYKINNIEGLQLRFSQKTELIPKSGISASFVRPGIIQLNKIRNRLGHDLSTRVESHYVSAIYQVLAVCRKGVQFASPIEAIEAFTPIASAFLSLPPPELQQVFIEAFKKVVTHDPEEI